MHFAWFLYIPFDQIIFVEMFDMERHLEFENVFFFLIAEYLTDIFNTHRTEPTEADSTIFLFRSKYQDVSGSGNTYIKQTGSFAYFVFCNSFPKRVLLKSGCDCRFCSI